MQEQLQLCTTQLDRGAAFGLITECEPFSTIHNNGGNEAFGVGVILGLLIGGLVICSCILYMSRDSA